jgi:hypothetical protein
MTAREPIFLPIVRSGWCPIVRFTDCVCPLARAKQAVAELTRLVGDDAESDVASRAVRDINTHPGSRPAPSLGTLILPSQLTSQRCPC